MSSKHLIVFIMHQEECYKIDTFDISTGKEVPSCSFEVTDLLKFFEKPPEFVKMSVKGIVCDIFSTFEKETMDHGFCEKLATKIKALNIPFRFMLILHIIAMCTFIAAKVDPEVGKEILHIFVQENNFEILEFSRRDDGYFLTDFQEIPATFDPKILLGSSNPTKIIISNALESFNAATFDELESALSKKADICLLKERVSLYLFDAVKEVVDHMYKVESSKKYFVFPQSLDNFGVTAVETNPRENEKLIRIKEHEHLPTSESLIISRFYKKFYITRKHKTEHIILQGPFEITKDGHRFKLTLSVDLNNYPTITHEAVILSRVKNMPKKLKIEKTEKLPIIGFFDNASVICIWNEEERCYKFLDSWNGKFGKDLFMDFLLPKPAIVSSSTDVTSLPGAVYDLIKIMSMPPNDITIDRNWKFTFTKDVDNPVLLEFDTFEKCRKQASPAFLIAMILKEHIRAIKKEIGKKPKKLGFRLLDEFENPEARKRVEAGLEEACEMIKVGFLLV